VAEGILEYEPRYSIALENTYMASSFDHPRHFYERSFDSFLVLQRTLHPSWHALPEARLHRQMHFARFSDVAVAARIPCSELATATAFRKLSLRTSKIA